MFNSIKKIIYLLKNRQYLNYFTYSHKSDLITYRSSSIILNYMFFAISNKAGFNVIIYQT